MLPKRTGTTHREAVESEHEYEITAEVLTSSPILESEHEYEITAEVPTSFPIVESENEYEIPIEPATTNRDSVDPDSDRTITEEERSSSPTNNPNNQQKDDFEKSSRPNGPFER